MPDSAPISALSIYPLKSGQGIDVNSFNTNTLGPENDRLVMVAKVTPEKEHTCELTSQRNNPELALIRTEIKPGILRLSLGLNHLDIPLYEEDIPQTTEVGGILSVKIHDQLTKGINLGPDCAIEELSSKLLRFYSNNFNFFRRASSSFC